MAIHCPKCKYTEMLEKDSGFGFMVDECPECGGRWYDANELQQRVKDKDKFSRAVSEGMLRPRPASRECPRCEETMTNGGLVSEFLRVDFCPKCQGFWLDQNEIGLLDRLLTG